MGDFRGRSRREGTRKERQEEGGEK